MTLRIPGADRGAPLRVGRARSQKRWGVLAAILAAMLIGAAAVTFSPAAVLAHDFTLIDHIGALCLLAISKILSPLHRVFEILFAAGLVLATVDRYRAWKNARNLIPALGATPPQPGSALANACTAASLAPGMVLTISDSPLPAFTSGGLRPRIYVNDRLPGLLSGDELVSVLAHEAEHVRRRDPLRLSVMRFVSRALYFLPAVRAMERHMAERAELRADLAAARLSGVATASALLVLVKNFGRVNLPALSAGLSHHEFLELRIKLLTGQNAAAVSTVGGGSLLATVAIIALLWSSALAELHEATHTEHLDADSHACAGVPWAPLNSLLCITSEPDRGYSSAPGSAAAVK